jgi:hypothetical protein
VTIKGNTTRFSERVIFTNLVKSSIEISNILAQQNVDTTTIDEVINTHIDSQLESHNHIRSRRVGVIMELEEHTAKHKKKNSRRVFAIDAEKITEAEKKGVFSEDVLGEVDLHPSVITRIVKRGAQTTQPLNAVKIAAAMGISIEDLTHNSEEGKRLGKSVDVFCENTRSE